MQILNYIWMNITLEWLGKHSCSTCTPCVCTKAATDIGASESKFKAYYHGGVVFPSCMHTTGNSIYFMRAAAVYTTSKKQMFAIRKHHEAIAGHACVGPQDVCCKTHLYPTTYSPKWGGLKFILFCNYEIGKLPLKLSNFHPQMLLAWSLI